MRLGDGGKYKVHDIYGRHLSQTGLRCGLSKSAINSALEEIADRSAQVATEIDKALPDDFPELLLDSVVKGINTRVSRLHGM